MNAALYRQILGVRFFTGNAQRALEMLESEGGLLVVPAAPALKDIGINAGYRHALLESDICLTDSMFMVGIWNWLQKDHLVRYSGLAYLLDLLRRPSLRAPGNVFWIMANPKSAATNRAWLRKQGFDAEDDSVYIAPMYGAEISDPELLKRIERQRPRHVIVTIGGGNQERLGLYLKQHLNYRPAIHCIGAAIAFLSGDQVRIPLWADKTGLGWLFRCFSQPRMYVPRYWAARKLYALIRRYGSELPPLKA